MRNLLNFCLLICLFWVANAQNQQIYTFDKVEQMPVFPGCENFKPTQKKQITQCISNQLSALLEEELKDFEQIMFQSKLEEAKAYLQFIVSKEGVILNVSTLKGSNPILAESAIRAMENIAMSIPPIQPARLKNGTPVNLLFQLPLVYKVTLPDENQDQIDYPVDEIVLFTLKPTSTSIKYEIRLYKNKHLKIYEVNENQTIFLGKFLSFSEIERSEPYKSLIDIERKEKKTLVAEGTMDGQNYEIYLNNFFDKNPKAKVFVEVFKIENNQRILVTKFDKESDFKQSPYVTLIYRD